MGRSILNRHTNQNHRIPTNNIRMKKSFLILFFLLFSGIAFSQTLVTLQDQCNCEVLKGTQVTLAGSNVPSGAETGDIYVNTNTGTIFFWDGNSWELTSTDTNTTNESIEVSGLNLVITDSNNNTISIPLSEIASAGAQGSQGIMGLPGDQGPQGEQGIQGIQGLPGDKGEKGGRGARGERGGQEDDGAQG